MLKIVDANTPAGKRVVQRLRAMIVTGDALIPDSARKRSKSVFGQDLTPAQSVEVILNDVRRKGDGALIRWTRKLDRASLTPSTLRVTQDALDDAWRAAPADFKRAFRRTIANVKRYQKAILPAKPPSIRGAGVKLSLRLIPLGRVGVYAPRSIYAYPSTLAMTVVPAHVAGVREIAVASPPYPDGTLNKFVLAGCKALRVTEVYRLGGAMAIGAFAYGTGCVPRVDKIFGPGSAFVACAKRAVRDIDAVDPRLHGSVSTGCAIGP